MALRRTLSWVHSCAVRSIGRSVCFWGEPENQMEEGVEAGTDQGTLGKARGRPCADDG